MKEAKFVRKGRVMIPLDGKEPPTTWTYINLAKRASRRIQMEEDGALGRGTVRLM